MGKKGSDFYIESETGNWNMSASYIEDLHTKLEQSSHFRTMCKFGVENIVEDLIGLNIPIDNQKIVSIKWFCESLRELTYDVLPCIKVKNTKTPLLKLKKELTFLSKKIDEANFIYNVKKDNIRKVSQKKLNKAFPKVLLRLEEIKREITEIMNKNDLIFAHKKEFNHEDFKKSIKDRMRNKG